MREAEAGPVDLERLEPDEREVVRRVVSFLREIDFGTVSLVVQDGRVVQIEMAEKFRLR